MERRRIPPLRRLLVLLAAAAWGNGGAVARGDGARVPAELLFAREIFPILSMRCLPCHGGEPEKLEGNLDLTSREAALAGGESGRPAVVAGDPDASLLYRAVTRVDPDLAMPPKENDRLTGRELAAIRSWIAGGAPWPGAARRRELLANDASSPADGGVTVRTSGGLAPEWTSRRYDPAAIWALRPMARPRVPAGAIGRADPAGLRGPIDAFIGRRLDAAGLEPAPPADRRTLIRRATFDLTGLPPTDEEIEAFERDPAPDAFERLLDRLLASPRHGEQWGRHWLDVVRYADSSGYANDFERPNAWRYRDYVIRSFNDDTPYDRFVLEQLAGDELDPGDPEMLIAVGFLRMGPWEHTGMSVAAVTRQLFLDDVTNVVGQTFLAQELRCARCHDHKFDPIPTRDYYRVQAIFAPAQLADRRVPFLDVENTSHFEEERARSEARLRGGIEGIEGTEDEAKGIRKLLRKRRAYVQRELMRFRPYALSVYDGPLLVQQSNKVVMEMPAQRDGPVQEVSILAGGSLRSPLEKVAPGFLSAIPISADSIGRDATAARVAGVAGAAGDRHRRRLALARWITSPENPLAARVIANRIWQGHLGRGLAANPNNFGAMGGRPTHPALLDWLARRLIDGRWSMKLLHRRIMTSAAYRRSSSHPDEKRRARLDPRNDLLARFSPRRLEAEELRDAMLAASGELELEMGGPPIRPEINLEVALQPRHIMGSVAPAYQPSRTPDQRNRRTIYAMKIRTLRDPMLEVFDQPSPDLSCERRDVSIIAPQAFTLFNSRRSFGRALAMARRAERCAQGLDGRIACAFRFAYGRVPEPAELERCRRHVEAMTAEHRAHPPARDEPPRFVVREMVEEMTGLTFRWRERLDVYEDYVPDLRPWEVGPETLALADLCLVLLNSSEFSHVY